MRRTIPYSVAAALLLVGCVVAARADEPKTAAPARRPMPSASEREAATRLVLEIFGKDIDRAASRDDKATIARKLLTYVDETPDSATQFVLLDKARLLAIEACDAEVALEAGSRVATTYLVDGRALAIAALGAMAPTVPAAKVAPVVDGLVKMSGESLAEDSALAEDLAQVAVTAARRGKDRERTTAALQSLAAAREAKKRDQRIKPLVDRLKDNPADGAAALELGSIRCFEEHDWDGGLRLLAVCSDPDLAAIAKRDLAVSGGATGRIACADAWCNYGKTGKGAVKAGAFERARFHYAAGIGEAKGLEKARIEKKLEELGADAGGAAGDAASPIAAIVRRIGDNVIWLDAADPKGLIGEGNAPLKPGQVNVPIVSWRDRTGRDIGFASGDPATRPVVVQVRGANRALSFDGVDDYLVARQWPESLRFPLSMVMVCGFSKAALADVRMRMLFDNAHGGEKQGFCVQLLPAAAGYALCGGTAAVPMARAEEWQVVTVVIDRDELTAYAGGRQAATRHDFSTNTIQPACFLGCWGTPDGKPSGRFFAGVVGECLVFRRALTAADVEALTKALQAKWVK